MNQVCSQILHLYLDNNLYTATVVMFINVAFSFGSTLFVKSMHAHRQICDDVGELFEKIKDSIVR
ncbi:hypothetical protein T08_6479 [Trichinella sp. T8]|nr:hypothetical protein T08_6479 [Trichinella sp. T8]